ncbi:MAG TPA: serine/threonine-protein kinase [Kofleriaceae bacterium]|jgi:serine/threonine protein kinase
MESAPVHVHPEEGMLPPGETIGSYRITGTAGAGGMGYVYRAQHALSGREVALKIMREDQLAQERAIDRMMREASILATVSHVGIPQFFECGVLEDGRPWIAMEMVQGTSLSQRLAQGVLPPDDVIDLVSGVADVLAAAHDRGVTHRDLKPDNILLCPGDLRYRVRVIDWGIAHHLDGARLTNMNEAIGTPTYMAPEQARGGPTDGHCDVYGLGVVAYQALTGKPPFSGNNAIEILVQHLNRPIPALAPRCPDAPYGLIELVEEMLGKRYEDRPDAGTVARTLEELRAKRDSRGMRAIDDAIPRVIPDVATAVIRSRPERIDD